MTVEKKRKGRQKPLRIRCLACEVFARPLYFYASTSPHIVDIELVEKALHNQPQELREILQTKIDEAADSYDMVVLAYGLCGKSTVGLEARKIPVAVPRAHDCITLFLGSRRRYEEEFTKEPGTFWYVHDYLERSQDLDQPFATGAGIVSDPNLLYQEYVDRYGQDNADFLWQVLGAWHSHYSRAGFIDTGGVHSKRFEKEARSAAEEYGWKFDKLQGNLDLLKKSVNGPWDDDDFLVFKPGEGRLAMTHDDSVITLEQ